MGIFESIKNSVDNYFEKRKEEKAVFNRMKLEAEAAANIQFEIDFKKNYKEVLIAKAKKDAARLSGVQKMRAENRLRNLQSNDRPPSGFLARMSEYTQRNKAKTEERLKQTEEKMRALGKTNKLVPTRKPFEPSGNFKRKTYLG